MARKLLLPDGKPRRVVLCAAYDIATRTASGTVHTLYLDDEEPHPETVDEVHEMLVQDGIVDRLTARTVAAISKALDGAAASKRRRRTEP